MPQTLPFREPALPHLEDDSPRSCPVTVQELIRCIRAKTAAKAVRPEDLTFVRTAQVYGCAYWVWRFPSDQLDSYALVMRDTAGDAWLSYYLSDAGLDPQQILLADYRVALQDD
jgi:hypothetical protein